VYRRVFTLSQYFLGEIRMFGGNFPPHGWALCNGQTLSIQQNTALFALLGTFYGGNGTTTFCLPNLQSRFPVHMGQGPGLSYYAIGEIGGTEAVSLTVNQIPQHSHVPQAASGQGTASSPSNAVWAESALNNYSASAPDPSSNMAPGALSVAGGSQPHNNMPPYLVVNFIIALVGIFPSRN
jgi:microcystin-dependent protein